MPDRDTPLPPIPEARSLSKKKTRISLVWFIPILAALVGAWVAVTRVLGQGPQITIVFKTAEGLEAGKTKIHYNGVDVGTITTIQLAGDHEHVITTAQMAPKTEGFLLDDTQFWVVSPRISGANVTGLSTLISGSYIGMEIGQSKTHKSEFVALDTPPVVSGGTPGRFFMLKSSDLGSLDNGTPIFFRRLQVGEVASYELDKDGKSLSVRVFVNAPYDQYVTPNTRFWQASGVDVSLTANGLSVQTQSFLSILVGGIAFETSATDPILPPAEPDTVFKLYGDRGTAFKLPARDPQTYVVVFKDSVRGLSVGAPVEFRGIQIGEVADIRAQMDVKMMEFSVPVTIRLDAERLGVKIVGSDVALDQANRTKVIEAMVEHGARAQLRTGNLLSGGLYVAFDFFPDATPVKVDWSQKPVELPTIPGDLQAIEANVVSIIKKLDKVPYQEIGDDLKKAIADLDKTLGSARTTLENADKVFNSADKLIEPNSLLGAELGNTLQEVSRAARSMRVLADYLERHPEALIRGKTGEAK